MTEPGHFDVQPTASNHFAWMRTRLGLERTIMAAVRTSVSLIGFGFTIVQFFQRLQDSVPEADRTHPQAPRDLGLALIIAGVSSLVIFLWQYHRSVRYLWSDQYKSIAGMDERAMQTPMFFVAAVVLLIGVAAFVSVFVRF